MIESCDRASRLNAEGIGKVSVKTHAAPIRPLPLADGWQKAGEKTWENPLDSISRPWPQTGSIGWVSRKDVA
jgi:hypothetical protein